MRGKQTLFMMAVLALVALGTMGCGNNDRAAGNRPAPDQAYAPAPGSAARVNLHPLTAPPPGAGQPLQGYAPTRITPSGPDYDPYGASYGGTYADAGPPRPMSPTYSNVAYGPGADPFQSGGMPFRTPTGYCTVEDVTPYSNPMVPLGDPPAIVNTPTGSMPYGRGYRDPAPGLTYGPVEGTADIAIPVGGFSGGGYQPPLSSQGYMGSGSYSGTTGYAPVGTGVVTPQPYQPVTGPAGYSPPAAYAPPAPAGFAPPLSSTSPAPVYGAGSAFTEETGGILAQGDATAYRLVPAPDVPPGNHPSDHGPSQWFEIIRPGNGPIRIGRVSSTCVCVGVRVPNRFIAAGERALIEARTVSRPQVRNVTYGIYVNIMEPIQTVVDADITVR